LIRGHVVLRWKKDESFVRASTGKKKRGGGRSSLSVEKKKEVFRRGPWEKKRSGLSPPLYFFRQGQGDNKEGVTFSERKEREEGDPTNRTLFCVMRYRKGVRRPPHGKKRKKRGEKKKRKGRGFLARHRGREEDIAHANWTGEKKERGGGKAPNNLSDYSLIFYQES